MFLEGWITNDYRSMSNVIKSEGSPKFILEICPKNCLGELSNSSSRRVTHDCFGELSSNSPRRVVQ